MNDLDEPFRLVDATLRLGSVHTIRVMLTGREVNTIVCTDR